jgi:dihydroorotase
MQLLIRQAKVILPGSGFHNKTVDILIKNGKIVTIGKVDADADKVIEAEGLHVSTGWVDILADYREPGYEQKETLESGLNAAATGGYTEVLLAPNTSPSISTKSIVEFVIRKASGNVVTLHPLGAASQDIEGKVLAEMLDMRAHGAVAFTDGWKPLQNANLVLKALEYVKAFNGVLIQIPAEANLSAGGLMHEGSTSTRLGMAGIPTMAETLIIHRDLELLRYTGSRLHITGVSSAEGVEMIRKAKAEGLDVTCSVTPYHLALTDEALTGYSSLYKVTPPLRTESDRQALIEGLADGTIDCIASHHRPQEWDAKEKEFEYAGEGMNVQEIAYNIALTAVSKKVKTDRLVDALSVKPREIFSLPAAEIAEGAIANLTLFTTTGSINYTAKDIQSISKNNPFTGKDLLGKVIGIINNNKLHLNK